LSTSTQLKFNNGIKDDATAASTITTIANAVNADVAADAKHGQYDAKHDVLDPNGSKWSA
jgi:hypothetical protein